MSTLKVDQLEAATASTITVPSGQTLDISSATLTPPATMPASSAANLTSIPAANITGTIAAVSGANLTALNATQLTSGAVPAARMPAGSVIQVIQAVKVSAWSSPSNNDTFNAVTGLSVDITPTSSSSKILVSYHVNVAQEVGAHTGSGAALFKDSSILTAATGTASDDRTSVTNVAVHYNDDDANAGSGVLSFTYLDSPGDTSSHTYDVRIYNASGGSFYTYVNRSRSDSDVHYCTRGASTITAMEVTG
jgi:hypothetical protein